MAIKWTFEKLKEEALRFKTRGEFSSGSKGAYLSAYRKGELDEICKHMEPSRLIPWTNEELYEEALKYKTREEFRKNSGGAYLAAYRRGIFDQVVLHMIRAYHIKYSVEELIEEALNFSSRIEFQKNSSGAYQAAVDRGLVNDICSHMEYICYPWSDKELQLEALKFTTRGEFQKNSSAYQAAQDRNILDQICGHMVVVGGISIPEIELFDFIKSVYPDTKKFRDRKVKIEGKPHIKGFDIDILVGSLGIEFDGEYWHSFKAMRRANRRRGWPDEDIRNYHQIKDDYFLSKGIRILHIREKDWLNNKQACVDKCLNFLGNSI